MVDISIFSQVLKKLRAEQGITQEELAMAINLSPSTISLYENCQRDPSLNNLVLIADYFDVSLDFLLGREKKLKTNQQDLSSLINEVLVALKEFKASSEN